MKWVKCIYNDGDNHFTSTHYLTIGKIYEVLIHSGVDTHLENIKVIRDNGEEHMFFIMDWFEDATKEVRDMKIKQILK